MLGLRDPAGLRLPGFSLEGEAGGKERLHVCVKVHGEVGLQCAAWHCSVPTSMQWLPVVMLLATLKQERRRANYITFELTFCLMYLSNLIVCLNFYGRKILQS